MMTAIQNKKSSIAAGLFAALLLTCTPVVNALDSAPATQTSVKTDGSANSFCSSITWGNAAWFTFFLMLARLWTREGDNSPSHYNLDELALGENIPSNLWYLVDDGVIGHFGKKPYLTVDTDNSRIEVALTDKTDANGKPVKDEFGNKVKVSTAVWPRGLMGWTAFYIKPIIGAAGVAAFTKMLFDTASSLQPGQNFFDAFSANVKQNLGFTIQKFTDYGAAPFVSALGGTIIGLGLAGK